MSDAAAAPEPAGAPARQQPPALAGVSYKRKRSSRACTTCRQKKVRCTGTEPCRLAFNCKLERDGSQEVPRRHCIEFGENCVFEEAIAQPTKTLSELQLRIIRLETYIVHFTGEDLQPLANFRGVDPEDGGGSWTATPSSRKRQRHEETEEAELNGQASQAGPRFPYSHSHDEQQRPSTLQFGYPAQSGSEQLAAQNPGRPENTSHAWLEDARYLQDTTSSRDTSLPRDHGSNQRPLCHPLTSRIRTTPRDLPPDEIFSTDEDETATRRDRQSQRQSSAGLDGSSLPTDSRGMDDNAPHSPPPSSRRGFEPESSHAVTPAASSAEMKRTGSASSAPAALGPTTAKISSSNVSDFRVDKKGNLRYLGSASTSAVVAELADRQRWDVESPAIILNAQNAAAAARRKSSVRPAVTTAGTNAIGDAASSSTPKRPLAPVEENDGTPCDSTPAAPTNGEFARPLMRPKPWEIFSNLGVTVAGALPPVEDIALPPEDLAKNLIEGFFEQIHPLFPVLHRAALVKDMNTVYSLRAKGEMRKADPPFLTLLFAVFACGALVSDDPRVHEEGGYSEDAQTYPVEQGPLDPFAQWQNDLLGGQSAQNDTPSTGLPRTSTYNFGLSDSARRQGVRRAGHRYYAQVNILILHSLFQPSVDQAVLYGLMAYYHVSSNAAARAWLLSGQALRLAIAGVDGHVGGVSVLQAEMQASVDQELGLHRSSANFKPYVRERRRRVFWALFSLESLLANNLGRPCSIPLYEIDQERPENVCLDDLLPTLTTFGPPRKGEIAGFLHLVKLHWILAETLRTISRHQRHTRPISAAELQKRLLKYEMEVKDWFCSFPPEYTFKRGVSPNGGLSKECLTQNYIMHLSFHCAVLLLFMPFMPKRGQEATEFQTYALARCVYACKDHIDFTARYQYPIPPSHYLFNITQHLLVAGALLLLICHRGLQDPELLDRTIKDVDSSIGVLKLIGQRFVGGTVGAEMLQNMKDNMKHSETWKTRQKKIAEAEAEKAANTNQSQGPLFPPIPLPGPRRMPNILQPNSGGEAPSADKALPSHPNTLNSAGVLSVGSTSSFSGPLQSSTTPRHDTSPGSGMTLFGNMAAVPSIPAAFTPQYSGGLLRSSYNAHEPGYLYPTQPSTVQAGGSEWQTPSLSGQGMTPPNGATSFLDDYLQMAGNSHAGYTPYTHPSMMQTYNTPESQPLWPSDNLNFNIKGLDEITARSYTGSFGNAYDMDNARVYPSSSSHYPSFQF